MVDLFEERAARSPHSAAVEFDGKWMTYAEVDAQANRLARHLIRHGIGPERIVALVMSRSERLVVSMLAVMKAGGAFLPIDLDYPAGRVAFMMEDAAPSFALVDGPGGAHVAGNGIDTLLLNGPASEWPISPLTKEDWLGRGIPAGGTLDTAAYVIYTSGSTGRPKGVVVSRRGLANVCAHVPQRFGVSEASRVLQVASPGFDASIMEVAMTLTTGGTLVIPAAGILAGEAIEQAVSDGLITHLQITPTALGGVSPERCKGLGTLVVAGEACTQALVDDWASELALINAYGPAETTICATVSDPLERGATPALGIPVERTHVYILDEDLVPVAAGAVGEMYLAGDSVARGYLKRSALTASRFVADPFGAPGTRMYRTGDLAQQTADGALVFKGRSDDQVKVRGRRIELGEIEAVLAAHAQVSRVVVSVREDRPGDQRLVGYVVPAGSAQPDVSALRNHAAQTLPDYMVPAAIMILPSLPLAPGGKLDRRALPAPQARTQAAGQAPRSERERLLCELLAEILGVESVGADDDFFSLGGHSMLAIQLANKARATADIDFEPWEVFEAPTMAQLAARARSGSGPRPALQRRAQREAGADDSLTT